MSKSYSSRLLNYTETTILNGVGKTVFYSEHNTNAKVGDKLFILNGNYDSDSYTYKYARNSKFVDGYRVLEIDKCRIVLDIDIDIDPNLSVYNELVLNEFIKIWNVRSERELLYYQTIDVDLFEQKVNRYAYRSTNDIIFIDSSYIDSGLGVFKILKTKYVNGVVTSYWDTMTDPRGYFFGFEDGIWYEDGERFKYNQYSDEYFNATYINSTVNNNGKIYIIGENIVLNSDITYRQGTVYSYTGDPGKYVIDIQYKKPIISKLNFRGGNFNGNYMDGIFGTYLDPIKWDTNGSWVGGFFINSDWISGEMNSLVNDSEMFTAHINNGKVVETSDYSKNGSFGYNYVIDSSIYAGRVNNGNFENCNIGSDNVIPFTKYEDLSNNIVLLEGGSYDQCDINGVDIDSVTLTSSSVKNTKVSNSRIIDSQISSSYINTSDLDANLGIDVLGAEILCDWNSSVIGNDVYVNNIGTIDDVFKFITTSLKLIISKEQYTAIDSLDSFFITKLNKSYFISSVNTSELIKMPIETKIVLDRFYNNDLSDLVILAAKKTSDENSWIPRITLNGGVFQRSSIKRTSESFYSIDIIISGATNVSYGALGYYYKDDKVIKSSNALVNKLNKFDSTILFNGASLSAFNIESGLVDNSKWISGSNMNNDYNKIMSASLVSGAVSVNLLNVRDVKIGDVIWVDGLSNNGVLITDTLHVTSLSGNNLILNKSGLGSFSGVVTMRTVSDCFISKVRIQDSIISGGFFNRTHFIRNTFNVENYIKSDVVTFGNVGKLCVVNTTFDYNYDGNYLINGIYDNCGFISGTKVIGGIVSSSKWYDSDSNLFSGGIFTNSGTWNGGAFTDGTFLNSTWNGGTFKYGIFANNSTWNGGTFEGGNFYNSQWVGGLISGGIFGDKAYGIDSTVISGNTLILDITVVNAKIGGPLLVWKNGTFNGGKFVGGIWQNGTFNSGDFISGIWQNGTFNGGKFISIDNGVEEFAWKNGTFKGGEFGNRMNKDNNPSWQNGVFQGGTFQGYLWNDGTFINGIFSGGNWENQTTVVDNISKHDYVTIVDEYDIISSDKFGIWNNGIVTANKYDVLVDEYTYVNNQKTRGGNKINNTVEFKNVFWKNGTFTHSNASFNDSIWLSGEFVNGSVNNSYINPYVRRNGALTPSFGITNWIGGIFNGGEIYHTNWIDGIFNNGEMWGSIWKNGIWNYGFANGILWENGRWRNGNWNGTPYVNMVNLSGDAYSNALISFVNNGIFVSNPGSIMLDSVHINNLCTYRKLSVTPGDLEILDNVAIFPSKWRTDIGDVVNSYVTIGANSYGTKNRVIVRYCDDTECYDNGDLFMDVFYGYSIEISFGTNQPDVYLNMEVGDMKGIPTVGAITPGTLGYDANGKPVIRLGGAGNPIVIEYFPKISDNNKSLSYQIYNSGVTSNVVEINDIKISRIKTEYLDGNNTIIPYNVSNNPLFPSGAVSSIMVENGNEVKFKYGNGSFNKGVWENGVWNDGYRLDESSIICSSIKSFIQVSEFIYVVELVVDSATPMSSFIGKKGDKVSVSNIVGIDTNEKRKLIKSSLVIKEIINQSVYVEVVSNYKLRMIRKDSGLHTIKLSLNVWLSGAFLNGVYTGIMNYGIVSGFPYITQMKDIHMIDGIFDGGKIGSDDTQTLVQNFTFYDNVVIKRNLFSPTSQPINKPLNGSKDRFYRSWAAFKYNNNNNFVNIFSDDTMYMSKWDRNMSIINHLGRSTNDVISSRSRFMNSNDIGQMTYDLGLDKYVYNEFIPLKGGFTYPFKVGSVNSSDKEFIQKGWEYSQLSSELPLLSANYQNNNLVNSNILFVDVPTNASFVLNNKGIEDLYYDLKPNIEEQRYSVIQFQMSEFVGDPDYDATTPSLFFGNSPEQYSVNNKIGTHLSSVDIGKVRYEYFYNRKSLDIFILNNKQNMRMGFNSIKFNEVSMIPFFNYFSDTNTSERIDDSAKAPKYILAPVIEYSDDYDFIDNISSTIEIASLNIPVIRVDNDSVGTPRNLRITIDVPGSKVVVAWSDPSLVSNILRYEVTYIDTYPYGSPIVVQVEQGGEYMVDINSLVENQTYTIRLRAVGVVPNTYSSYVSETFVFKPSRVAYYKGYAQSPPPPYYNIYFTPNNLIYIDETTFDVYDDITSNIPISLASGTYRIMSLENMSKEYSYRNSIIITVNNNKVTFTNQNPIAVQLICYEINLPIWDKTNNSPPLIPSNPSNLIRKQYVGLNVSSNIKVNDWMYNELDIVNGGYPKLSTTKWVINIQNVNSISNYYNVVYDLLRVDNMGVIYEIITNRKFRADNLSIL